MGDHVCDAGLSPVSGERVIVELSKEQHGLIVWKLNQIADLCLSPAFGPPTPADRESATTFWGLADAMQEGVRS